MYIRPTQANYANWHYWFCSPHNSSQTIYYYYMKLCFLNGRFLENFKVNFRVVWTQDTLHCLEYNSHFNFYRIAVRTTGVKLYKAFVFNSAFAVRQELLAWNRLDDILYSWLHIIESLDGKSAKIFRLRYKIKKYK